jgi:hypothetical protein
MEYILEKKEFLKGLEANKLTKRPPFRLNREPSEVTSCDTKVLLCDTKVTPLNRKKRIGGCNF